MPFNIFQVKSARAFWLNLHLYLGLTVGAVFVISGLTGSLLVFYIELDQLLHPELIVAVKPEQQKKSYETVFKALQQAHPHREGAWAIEVPENADQMITARFYKPQEKADLAFAPLQSWVDPYTGQVVESRFWGEYLMTWIYDLHFTLLMDLTGRDIVAFIGLAILISLLTGMYLWWPKRKGLKRALSVKFSASSQRKIYDVHKLTGVYGGALLVVIVATGVLLDFSQTKPIVNAISPLHKPDKINSLPTENASRLDLDEVVSIAQALFPSAQLKWIVTPENSLGSYRINLRQQGEPSIRFPKTNVWIDQYSGDILSVRNVTNDAAGDTFLRWLHPLHSGEAFGLMGRIVVCLAGLLPLLLFSTGVIRWRQKRRNQSLK
jgi:uncharacterized iron-regulated membrane protein